MTHKRYIPETGRADKHASNTGAPVDFSGPVIANPMGLQPKLDTASEESTVLGNGAKLSHENFSGPLKGTVGNAKQMFPDRILREQ